MVSSEETTYRYNWQDLPEYPLGFFRWLLPTLLAHVPHETVDMLSDMTKQFTDVDLGVTINGVEVDTRHFMESIEHNMTAMTNDAARELVRDHLGMDTLIDGVNELERQLRQELVRRARKLGIDLETGDDD